MIRKVSIASVAALVAASGAASARNYTGSDTLRVFTQTLVTQCGATGSFPALAGASPQFSYVGGGSGQGGTDMRNGEQDIAPQSRALSNAEACEASIEANPSTGSGNLGNDEAAATISPPGSDAEGLVIGLDGMSIAVSQTTGGRCDPTADTFAAPLAFSTNKTFPVTNFTSNVPDGAPTIATFVDVPLPAAGTDPATQLETVGGVLSYRIKPATVQDPGAPFKDVLRILFAGADKTRAASAAAGGGGGNTQTAANRLSRCSSDIRRSLVSNWDNIIESCGTTAGNCAGTTGTQQVRRLYRRADDSGTTDVFLALLGLGGIANQPFCNGTERQDQDPIRRSCLAEDDVCGRQNGVDNLGLVQAVELYQLVGVTAANMHAAWYPTQTCATGIFVLRDAPILPGGGSALTCPDGAPQVLGQCLTPQANPVGSASPGANCLNPQSNRSLLSATEDGRVWNRELRAASGNMRSELIPGQSIPTGVTNAIHRSRSRVGGVGQCANDDATLQIGCIAGNMACALGYAGREATDNPSNPVAIAAPVGNVAPTVNNIQALINSTLGTPYPLARKLYFNSVIGFDKIRDEVNTPSGNDAEQEQLIRCLEGPNAAPHQAALLAAGFIPLPALPAGQGVPGRVVEFRTGGGTTPGLICEDVNEITACGGSVDAPNCLQL
ncbi:MAG TPA: hypothetical protein VJU61_26090 [Polyangiaceae bacterium]|nr:hypothetical protein [Polyangiaceae bacterium]